MGEVLQRRQVRGRHHHHRPDRDCLGRAQLQRCHPHPPHPGLLQEALLRRALSLACNASPDLFPETSSMTVFPFLASTRSRAIAAPTQRYRGRTPWWGCAPLKQTPHLRGRGWLPFLLTPQAITILLGKQTKTSASKSTIQLCVSYYADRSKKFPSIKDAVIFSDS